MSKKVKSLKRVGMGTADAFFMRSAVRAQRLDRGERLLPEMRPTFEDPADLLPVLTAQRVRVLDAVRGILHRFPNWRPFSRETGRP
jgi:hypothetical protein